MDSLCSTCSMELILFFYLILKRIDLKYIFLFILLYITITGLFNNQLNALRQATAIYMGTYALILIVERKKWKAFFLLYCRH